jgi:ADP-ribose pyrophosphatase YjhB (NUDIX family)
MHTTQIQILNVLRKRSPRRYMELKPKEVESNTFMHHLRTLIKADLLVKQDDTYALTPEGDRFILGLVANGMRKSIQPIILVEVACQSEGGEWLLTKCEVEPFLGLVGFPAGKIHFGESAAAAAQRIFQKKTGLFVSVEHVGNMYQQTYRHDELICHLLTHVFIGKVHGGELKKGTAFWKKDMDLSNWNIYFPGLYEVMKNIRDRPKTGQFFAECLFEY